MVFLFQILTCVRIRLVNSCVSPWIPDRSASVPSDLRSTKTEHPVTPVRLSLQVSYEKLFDFTNWSNKWREVKSTSFVKRNQWRPWIETMLSNLATLPYIHWVDQCPSSIERPLKKPLRKWSSLLAIIGKRWQLRGGACESLNGF